MDVIHPKNQKILFSFNAMNHTRVILKHHNITIWLRLSGTSGDCLVHCPGSSQGQLDWAAQELVQMDFEYLQDWRLQVFSEHPAPEIDYSYSKKDFSCV